MPWSPVSWAAGSELTSAKLAQMVENLAVHDHRFAGGQGNPHPRFAGGVILNAAPIANTTTFFTVTYPAGRFDPDGPIPRPFVNAETGSTTVLSWGSRNETISGFEAWVHRTNTSVLDLTWFAIQSIG